MTEKNINPAEKGLECKKCGCSDFKTHYTRKIPGGIRRLKICRHCGKRQHTIEKVW